MAFWKRFRTVFGLQPRADVEDELSFHVEMRARELVERGESPARARELALRRFGDYERSRDACVAIDERRRRRVLGVEFVTERREDAADALRALRRAPGFTLIAVPTLALGIGAATTVFTAARALLVQPEIALGGENVVVVWGTNRAAGQARDVVSGPTFADLRRETRTLAALAAFHFTDVTIRATDRTTVLSALQVTPEFFAATEIRPAMGRTFEPSDVSAHDAGIVISHGFWQRQFGGDPSAVGRTVLINGQPREVIGVLPSAFRFFAAPDVVILLRPSDLAGEERTYYFYWLVGRLGTGVSPAQAEDDLDRIMAAIAAAHPSARGWDVTVERLEALLDEPVEAPANIALMTALLVLLVVSANVASLVLARHVSRRRELAVRMSLGASRRRVLLGLLAEETWLSIGGGAAGVVLAAAGVAMLNRLMPPSVAIGESAGAIALQPLTIDWMALVFALTVSIATVALCGLGPAWRASRQDPQTDLVPMARGSTASASDHRLRNGLVSLETALATVLLVVAFLMLQTVARLNAIDPGFRGDGVVTMSVGRVDDLGPADRARYYTEVLRRVAEVAGVQMAALNDYVLLTNEDDYEGLEIEGHPRLASGQWPREEWRRVSSDYFRTLSIPIVRGRGFTPHDTADSASVVVVNEAMARKYWPDADPIGRRLRLTARPYGWSAVVGIVGDVHEVGLDQPAKPMMFVPYQRGPRPVMALFARVDAGTAARVEAIQAAIWSVDPTRPVYDVRRVDRLVADSLAVRRLAERVSGAAALLALALAVVGVYGTLSYSVSQRRREIGVRVAIGARPGDVMRQVLRQGTAPAAVGLGAGLIGAAWAASLASHQLYGVSPYDPWTYALGAGVLTIAALAACVVPALRASRIDPVIALRLE